MSGKNFRKPISLGLFNKSGILFASNSLSVSALHEYLKNIFFKPKNDWIIAENAKVLNFFPGGFSGFSEKMNIAKI